MEDIEKNERKDEVFTGHKPVDIDILNKVRESICKIIVNKNENQFYGTGFFMKGFNSKKYLITNYHVFNLESLKEKIEIEIWNKKRCMLDLDNFNIKYLKKPKDITALEIKKLNGIFKEVEFLNYDKNYENGYLIYRDLDVFTIEHPLGKNASCSSGKIFKINNFEFQHNISTEPGSSGCPILLLNDNINTIKVIGIHKNGDKKSKLNGGTFIGELINEIKNDSNINKNLIAKNYIIAEIYIDEENINKNIRIINSYEEYMRNKFPNSILNEYKMNEKEIEECEIEINYELIPFSYCYKYKDIGKYIVKYSFENYLININYIFSRCENLVKVDLSNFNTSNVNDMSFMFNECNKLKEIKGINNLITNNVINISSMFKGCNSLEDLDLSTFNTSNVINMSVMFGACNNLKYLNISNFNTLNVNDMSFMFNECKKLKIIKGINGFITYNVTNMSTMFQECSELEYLDLSNFNTSNITDMSFMFNECYKLKEIKGLNNFITDNVTNMNTMFGSCKELEYLDLSNFNTSNVKDMSFMFDKCIKLQTIIGINNFITNNVVNMSSMFGTCSALENLDLSNFNTSNVSDMSLMFNKCNKLKEIKGIDKFNTNDVLDMKAMFQECSDLDYLDLSNFNTSTVMDMSFMFNGCKKIKVIIGINDFITNNVTNMTAMFQECGELESLDLSNFNTTNVTDMSFMFFKCNNLKYLNLLNFSMNGETKEMFGFSQTKKCEFITNNEELLNLYNSTKCIIF